MMGSELVFTHISVDEDCSLVLSGSTSWVGKITTEYSKIYNF